MRLAKKERGASPAGPAPCLVARLLNWYRSDLGELALGGLSRRRIAQHVAAAPYCLDIVLAAGRLAQLLPELADEDVDDLELGLVHAAVEMIEEHLLGERGALPEAQELEDAVFLAGEAERRAVDLDGPAIQVDQELAGADHRFRMTLGAAHDRLDARDQLPAVEG